MKKGITVATVVVLVVAFGYFLFKSSNPGPSSISNSSVRSGALEPKSVPDPLREGDHVLGNPGAKNTFVAYEDFQCPACAASESVTKAIPTELPDTKFIFRYFPLTQIHQNSVASAFAAEAAGEQGKFWEMKAALFENQEAWSLLSNPLETFLQYAQSVGVPDVAKFQTDMTSGKYKERVERDLTESLSLDLPGTPSFFFNGKRVESGNLASIKQQAQAILAAEAPAAAPSATPSSSTNP